MSDRASCTKSPTGAGRLGVLRGAGEPSLRRPWPVALVLAAAFLVLAAPAQAAHTRIEVGSFGELSSPTGVAIDQGSGDVYVADTANHRIEKFSESGAFLLAFGKDVGGTGVDTCTSSCQPGTAGSGPGAFEGTFERFTGEDVTSLATEERLFLAVDQASHDLYVGDPGDKLVSKFDSSGNLIGSWGNNGLGGTANGQLNGDGVESFQGIAGISVGSTGTLYVYGFFVDPSGGHHLLQNSVFEFEPDGSIISKFTGGEYGALQNGLAVNAAGDTFTVNSGGAAETFNPAGAAIGTVTPFNFLVGIPITAALAIEPASGDLYVAVSGIKGGKASQRQSIDHYAFNGTGEVLEPGGSACEVVRGEHGCQPTDSVAIPSAGSGISVNSTTGDVYLADPTTGEVDVYEDVPTPDVGAAAPTEVTGTAATLNGSVDTAGSEARTALTGCRFQYVSLTRIEENETEGKGPFAGAAEAACEPPFGSIPNDDSSHPVTARIEGLQPGTRYSVRLVAENQNAPNQSAVAPLETAPPPSIEAERTSEITASSALLSAKVNPRGSAATCAIEWGPATEPFYESPYATTEPCSPSSLGGGASAVPVTLALGGLAPNTTYHWRLVAENGNGVTVSPEETFVFPTEGTPEPETPCRNEALRTGPAAALPDCRAYEQVTAGPKNGALLGGVPFVSPDMATSGDRLIVSSLQCLRGASSCNVHRGAAYGVPIEFERTGSGWTATPMAPASTLLPHSTPIMVNATAGTALFSAPTEPGGEDDFYAREPSGVFLHLGPVTPPEGGAHGPEGGSGNSNEQIMSPDLSHVVWEARSPFLWSSFDATSSGDLSLYEYVGDGASQPLLVGVSGGEGSTDLISTCGTNLRPFGQGRMSADGRVVYFTAHGGNGCAGSGANAGSPIEANQLYARIDGEGAGARTVHVSARSAVNCTNECASSPVSDAEFSAASADGKKAVFLSTQQLTDSASEDSQAKETAFDHGCAKTVGNNGCNLYLSDLDRPAGDKLIAVSSGDTSGRGPRVRGVMAFSEDGSHLYFVAGGVLTAVANARGESARSGANNLYVYERDAKYPSGHVAFIADLPSSDNAEWQNVGDPANVTPDGRYLVFVGRGDLTQDDTSRSGARQVFRYDAETGALIRISVGNDGFNDNGNRAGSTPCAVSRCSEDASIAFSNIGLARRDLTMSDDGLTIFFRSPVALAPHAQDDRQIGVSGEGIPEYAQNVYEWHGGHVYLISDGEDVARDSGQQGGCAGASLSAVCLVGTDVTGENVIFSTVDQLTGSDSDTSLDFYDARVGGGFAQPARPEPCLSSEACHGSGTEEGSAPSPATPGFSGPAEGPNHPRTSKCRKGSVKRHGKCVKKKRAKGNHKQGAHRQSGGHK